MTSRETPRLSPARRAEHAARDKRLAEALRENLRRRKEQTRARETEPGAEKGKPGPHPNPPPLAGEEASNSPRG